MEAKTYFATDDELIEAFGDNNLEEIDLNTVTEDEEAFIETEEEDGDSTEASMDDDEIEEDD